MLYLERANEKPLIYGLTVVEAMLSLVPRKENPSG
jgi:hypothetical protein